MAKVVRHEKETFWDDFTNEVASYIVGLATLWLVW